MTSNFESSPFFLVFVLEVNLSLTFKYPLPGNETADSRSDTWLFDLLFF